MHRSLRERSASLTDQEALWRGQVDLRPHAVAGNLAPSVGQAIQQVQAPPTGIAEDAGMTSDRGKASPRHVRDLNVDSLGGRVDSQRNGVTLPQP